MTENSINNLLNPTPPQNPPPASAPTAANTGTPNGGGGSGVSAVDPTALRNAGKTAPEVNSHIRAGGKAFPPETDRAAGALGSGWATADAMKQIASEWLRTLNRMTDEIEYVGDAVERCATNAQWAEQQMTENINRIRTGAH